MRQPAKPKPNAAEEVVRVMRVFEMLYDEFRPTDGVLTHGERIAILAVAERIAARTADPRELV